ncbi:MAG: GTPase Era [Gammaproteobacteria bacterium]|nr:MAG: GTPase Era [Gammaproteobacteria bacterium]
MSRRCGCVAIVGRPNVGKSTLLNYLVGQKLSITSRKPQTTRDRVIGIHTEGDTQMVFVDTPGMHKAEGRAINRYMNREAMAALNGVDVVLMVVEAPRWTEADDAVLSVIKHAGCPVILVLNKIDKMADKSQLLPFIASVQSRHEFRDIVPVSALKATQLDRLLECVTPLLPESEFWYPEDQVTDRSERFLVAEIIREKIMRQLGEEIPYRIAVGIDRFVQEGAVTHIDATIYVERAGQKAIVIGDKGQRLKQIGEDARADIERMLDGRVMLGLWVKVRSGWSDDERILRSLGYDNRE